MPLTPFRFAGLLLITACAAGQRSPELPAADLAITNVAVVDVERGRLDRGRTILVRQGRIVAVVPFSDASATAAPRTVDGAGAYVIPGLWDMHAHLTLSGRPTDIEMPLFIAHGVTGVRVMGTDRPASDTAPTPVFDRHREWRARIDSGQLTGPRILAIASWPVNGAAGVSDTTHPFFNARTREEGRRLAAYFHERGYDFIKVYNNVSREGFLGLAEEARRLGIPFAGHEPAGMTAIELSNAGLKSIEHSRVFLRNCYPGADSLGIRTPGSSVTSILRRAVDEYDPAICAEVFRTFARNGTYITPTHLTRRMDAFAHDSAFRKDERLPYVSFPQLVRWTADANRMAMIDSASGGRRAFMDFYLRGLELTGAAYRAGVPLLVGTDAGDTYVFPGSGLHDELAELVKAGLTPAEVLRAATLGGAQYLDTAAHFGTVQPGRHADLVLLEANPLEDIANTRSIRAVMLGGRVYERAELDSMLESAKRAARGR